MSLIVKIFSVSLSILLTSNLLNAQGLSVRKFAVAPFDNITGNASDEWREFNEQTVTFHYDVHDLNFVYVFFYLTECNRSSGAHQLIRGSHLNKKFFKHLIGSAKQKKENLEQDYDINDFIVVEGSTGYGFIEDTSCYHRALKPTNKPRLALQFRYQ